MAFNFANKANNPTISSNETIQVPDSVTREGDSEENESDRQSHNKTPNSGITRNSAKTRNNMEPSKYKISNSSSKNTTSTKLVSLPNLKDENEMAIEI